MTTTYQQLGTQIGELTDEKNAAYGSSFAKSGDFLRLLFPDGIAPNRMEDALLLVRIFDKQMRIATDQDAFGESPFQDIAGYGLLGAQLHKERRATCQGSAKGPDVKTPSKEQPDSATSNTSERTTTNERRMAGPEPSPTPSSSSHLPVSALAATAREIAKRSVVDRALSRNNHGTCGATGCCAEVGSRADHFFYAPVTVALCSNYCYLKFRAELLD